MFVVRRTVRRFIDHQGTHVAAGLTYYAVLSLFPALTALLAMVSVVGEERSSIDTILEVLAPLVSTETLDRVRSILLDLADTQGAGITLAVSLLFAIWLASTYVRAFGVAMNRIYDVAEGRPGWRLVPTQVLVTVFALLLCALALTILVVTGPLADSVRDALGVEDDVVRVWEYAKWPVLAVTVILVVSLLYHFTPNVRFRKYRIITVGAFLAITVWVLASAGFAFYVANFSRYDRTYGVLAGVVVALLWLWITNLALVFGAELDAELERARELRRGLPAEERLQLPVRDERGIRKAEAREQRAVARMREVRVAAAGPGDPADRPFGRRGDR